MNTFAKLVGLLTLGCGLLSINGCGFLPRPAVEMPIDQYGAELEESFTTLQEGVAALVTSDGSPYCSGVFVADNKVLTAAHCVDDGASGLVFVSSHFYFDKTYFWKSFEFAVLSVDSATDAAVLIATTTNLPPSTPMSLAEDVYVGDRVYSFGHPFQMPHYYSEGRVVDPVRDMRGQPYTLVDSRVMPGMSGGPTVNTRGQVIGLNSFYWADPSIAGLVTLGSLKTILGD